MAGTNLSRKAPTIRISLCLPETLWKKIQSVAAKTEDSSASREIRKAAEFYLDHLAKKEARSEARNS